MIAQALLRFLIRTPWSSFMALLGVTLGVVSIVSVHLVSAKVADQLESLIPDQLAGYSHFAHRTDLSTDDYFSLRKRWRAGDYPSIQDMSVLIDEPIQRQGQTLRLVGLDLFTSVTTLPGQSGGEEGRPFSWQGVWVDESLDGKVDWPVNGVIDAPAGTVVADIGFAQQILGWEPTKVSYIGLSLADPWRAATQVGEALLPGFAAGFPVRANQVLGEDTWRVNSLAQQNPATAFGKSVLFNVSALGLLALLVAWFLIYQVAVSWLRRLWPVMQRLHIVGVEWHTLCAWFVLVLAWVGTLAAVAGTLLGMQLAQLLLAGISDHPEQVSVQLDVWVTLKAGLSSIGVCCAGGAWAFRKAQAEARVGIRPAMLLLSFGLSSAGVYFQNTGLAGAFLSIALLSVLTVLIVAPVLKRLRRYAPMIRGSMLFRLSLRESFWYPQEMSVALAALSLAVATAIGVGMMVDSFRSDFDNMLERRLSYDVVVEGAGADLQALSSHLSTLPDLNRSQRYSEREIRVAGVPMRLSATRVDAVEAKRYGQSQPLPPDGLLVSEQARQFMNVRVGDAVMVAGQGMTIVGEFSSFGDLTPRLIVDAASPLAQSQGQLTSVTMMADHPQELISSLAPKFPDLQFALQSEVRATALATFDRTFVITTILIFIAMVVASLGMYVAVTAMRMSRPTTGRLLNSLGINRGESLLMDFGLGIGMGSVAMLFAVPLGLTLGWILCRVVNPRAFGWAVEPQISMGAVLEPVVLGLLAAALAGILRVGRSEEGIGRGAR